MKRFHCNVIFHVKGGQKDDESSMYLAGIEEMVCEECCRCQREVEAKLKSVDGGRI